MYSDGPPLERLSGHPALDRDAAASLAGRLFPPQRHWFRLRELRPSEDADLDWTYPARNEVYVGCFPGLSIAAAQEFLLDRPSQLPKRFLDAAGGRDVYLFS